MKLKRKQFNFNYEPISNYTYHDNAKEYQDVRWRSLQFTSIIAINVNYNMIGYLTQAELWFHGELLQLPIGINKSYQGALLNRSKQQTVAISSCCARWMECCRRPMLKRVSVRPERWQRQQSKAIATWPSSSTNCNPSSAIHRRQDPMFENSSNPNLFCQSVG